MINRNERSIIYCVLSTLKEKENSKENPAEEVKGFTQITRIIAEAFTFSINCFNKIFERLIKIIINTRLIAPCYLRIFLSSYLRIFDIFF